MSVRSASFVQLLGFLSVVAARPLPHNTFPPAIISPTPRTTHECGFAGNSDFYGLGIRLGVYLQWLTSLLANHFLAEAISDALDTNAIFVLALFVALILATAQMNVRAAEVVVLLQLCFGFLFSILSIWGHRIGCRGEPVTFSIMGSFFRLSLSTAICAYAVWFWFPGVHGLDKAECAAFTFLFAKVNVLKGALVFFKLQAVLVLIPFSFLFLREAMLMIWFYCSTGALTMLAFGAFGILEARRAKWSALDGLKFLFTKGAKGAVTVSWARANGSGSSGPKRPALMVKIWFFINICLISLWLLAHFLFLCFFKRSPMPAIPPTLHKAWYKIYQGAQRSVRCVTIISSRIGVTR